MTPLAVLALTGALLCWPGGPPARRLATACPPSVPTRCPALRGPTLRRLLTGGARAPVALTAGMALGALLAGVGGALAAAVAGATALRTRRGLAAERARAEATGSLAEGLGSFAAEVRAGAAPAVAADTAAADAHPLAARTFGLVAATVRLGGDVPAALRGAAGREPAAGDHLYRLAAAWALAEHHGIALAGPAEAVAVDLRARTRVAGKLRAQLAGPRATAAVLAGLPVLGVLLGEGIGARPWAVLSGTGLGQVLLVVGVGLACTGLLWTAHIAAGVAR